MSNFLRGRMGRPILSARDALRLNIPAAYWLGAPSTSSSRRSGAATLALGETQALSFDFTDSFWQPTTGFYGSAYIKDTGTPANDYNTSPDAAASSKLTYTAPSAKMCRGPSGNFRFGAHNLYLNSAAPANQSITVISGMTYAVTITGSVSVTASGAATGTWTAGTNTFTAATATLTLGSTSGAGTVHVRRTPSDSTYLETAGSARYALPYEWSSAGVLLGLRAEPAATNLIFPSVPVSGGTNLTITANTTDVLAPDGLNSASKFEVTTTAATVYNAPAIVASFATMAQSLVVKKGSGATDLNKFAFRNNTTATTILQWTVNYDTLAIAYSIGSSGVSVEELGGGWLRIIATVSSGITIGDSLLHYVGSTGASETAGKTLYVWHRQFEAGDVATSIIPTTTASATRAIDQITLSKTLFPAHSSELSMVSRLRWIGVTTTTPTVFELRNAGATERMTFFRNPSGNHKMFSMAASVSSVDLFATGSPFAVAGVDVKYTGRWKLDDFAFSVSGGAVATDTSGNMPGAVTTLHVNGVAGGNYYVQQVLIVPRGMSNAELVTGSTL